MTDAQPATWENAQELIARWHRDRSQRLGHTVFAFLECELRLMTPASIRRSWPEDLVEEALRSFLVRLLENPLPDGIDDLRAYLKRSFRNRCIDYYRRRARLRETPLVADAEWASPGARVDSPLDTALLRERQAHTQAAITRLAITDRVALKLEYAPEWLTEEETQWLAEQSRLPRSTVQAAVSDARDTHALTRIFDPGDDDPHDTVLRRARMERFRRRVSRALEKLRELLKEER